MQPFWCCSVRILQCMCHYLCNSWKVIAFCACDCSAPMVSAVSFTLLEKRSSLKKQDCFKWQYRIISVVYCHLTYQYNLTRELTHGFIQGKCICLWWLLSNLSANGYSSLPCSYGKHGAWGISLFHAQLTKDIGLVPDQMAVIYTMRLVLISKAFNEVWNWSSLV